MQFETSAGRFGHSVQPFAAPPRALMRAAGRHPLFDMRILTIRVALDGFVGPACKDNCAFDVLSNVARFSVKKFAVTVEFVIDPAYREEFLDAVMNQAANSMQLEKACVRFDVCEHSADPNRMFLYELYENESAFKSHLESGHFLRFDKRVSDWVIEKTVTTWSLL